MECTASHPGRFTPGKRPGTHGTGGCVDPRAVLDGLEKRGNSCPCGIDTGFLGPPSTWTTLQLRTALRCFPYYAASNGNFLPKLWDSLWVPSSRVQLGSAWLSKTLVRACRLVRRLCHKTGIFISTAVRTSNLDLSTSNLGVYLSMRGTEGCITSNGWM
jgi:hypothetical protein